MHFLVVIFFLIRLLGAVFAFASAGPFVEMEYRWEARPRVIVTPTAANSLGAEVALRLEAESQLGTLSGTVPEATVPVTSGARIQIEDPGSGRVVLAEVRGAGVDRDRAERAG